MTQPSGWYDDPADPTRLRYWDGILWTDNTVPKQSPSAGSSTIGWATDPYAAQRAGGHPPGAPGTGYPPAGPGPVPGATAGPAPGPSGPGAPPPASQPPAPPWPTPYGQPPPGVGYGAAPTVGWRPTGPTTPDGTPLAQWWQRLLAALVDNIVLGLLVAVFTFPWWRDFLTWYTGVLRQVADDPNLDLGALTSDIGEQTARFLLPATLIGLIVSLVYSTVFLTRWGATPGKLLLGIRVRRVARPGPLTVVEALRRQALQAGLTLVGLVPIASLLAGPASIVDNLWLLWDPRRQCLHDKIADTLVEVRPRPLR